METRIEYLLFLSWEDDIPWSTHRTLAAAKREAKRMMGKEPVGGRIVKEMRTQTEVFKFKKR